MNPTGRIFLTLAVLLAARAPAQLLGDRAVSATGGGVSVAGPYTLTDTVGGEVIGESVSEDYAVRAGFHGTLNLPPTAAQDTLVGTAFGGKLRLDVLLANDKDDDGDAIELLAVGSSSNEGGTVTSDNGWLFYQPPSGWSGTDLLTYVVGDADGHRSIGTVWVRLAQSSEDAPRTISRLRILAGGERALSFAGIAGRSYSIQFKNDLSEPSWTELDVRTAAPNGLFEFVDTELPAPPQRYFRAMIR